MTTIISSPAARPLPTLAQATLAMRAAARLGKEDRLQKLRGPDGQSWSDLVPLGALWDELLSGIHDNVAMAMALPIWPADWPAGARSHAVRQLSACGCVKLLDFVSAKPDMAEYVDPAGITAAVALSRAADSGSEQAVLWWLRRGAPATAALLQEAVSHRMLGVLGVLLPRLNLASACPDAMCQAIRRWGTSRQSLDPDAEPGRWAVVKAFIDAHVVDGEMLKESAVVVEARKAIVALEPIGRQRWEGAVCAPALARLLDQGLHRPGEGARRRL